MADEGNARKPRADGERNRAALIAAARAAFGDLGSQASLEEVARRAGLGIGTLYRHFPTRPELVEALYRDAMAQLAQSAERQLAEHKGIEALRLWLVDFVDYIARKHVLAEALERKPEAAPGAPGVRQIAEDAVARLCAAGIADGSIRPGTRPADVMQLILGLSQGSDQPGWRESVLRLIAIVIAGISTA